MSVGQGSGDDDLAIARAGLVLSLRTHGVTDHALLSIFESTPHHLFVPEEYGEYAYRDASLPIECGQSITSPIILARLLVLLDPVGAAKALEIGTGSGYASALLAKACKRVFSIERFQELFRTATQRWEDALLSNIVGFHGDGLLGLSQHAPFDRILLTASVENIPECLIEQLADSGILVAPVGAPNTQQTLTKIVREGSNIMTSEHGTVRLAPLVSGKSRAL
jgi:protein-L-isoaspartate(D-aspartate) O-methyltransferase